ncbi:MAG TPA: hypothetical protein VKP11_06280, partial [Frankiaceae bacterium]|nr:hypothetical protein [Frankiaceae bacterium]
EERRPAGGPVPAAGGDSRPADTGELPTTWLAVPTGRTFHRPDCRLLAGKPTQRVGPAEVAERKLTPCRLCDPLGATVTTG